MRSWLRRRVYGISMAEARFDRRGFPAGQPDKQRKLESIGYAFLTGYHFALDEQRPLQLAAKLESVALAERGFAFEGAAMALTLLDHLAITRKNYFRAFLEGPGESHAYMVHVGAGWAFARLPWLRARIDSAINSLDPLLRWLTVDGFGFHEGYFYWPRVGVRQQVPGNLRGYARRAFDQGLGRSIWFVNCADPKRISETVGRFNEQRRGDLWSGIGLACAYAGSSSDADLAALCTAAKGYSAELAQGAAFAAKARLRAGNLAPHTEHACQVLCGVSASEAAGITDASLKNLPENGARPTFEIWRQRIQSEFVTVRR